jgi:hypothetical protein
MRTRRLAFAAVAVALAFAGAAAAAVDAATTLTGETATADSGIFFPTTGTLCPTFSRVGFVAEGEATGPYPGSFAMASVFSTGRSDYREVGLLDMRAAFVITTPEGDVVTGRTSTTFPEGDPNAEPPVVMICGPHLDDACLFRGITVTVPYTATIVHADGSRSTDQGTTTLHVHEILPLGAECPVARTFSLTESFTSSLAQRNARE